MTGNTILGSVYLSFNQSLKFNNNVMYGFLNYGDSYLGYWNYKIYNNVFSGGGIIARGSHSVINYNNFIDSAYLYCEGFYEIEAYDNNFCTGITGSVNPEKVYHNNYYPLTYLSYNDSDPLSYDPMYDPNQLGIATNPLLQGKGISIAPEKDFLGNTRENPPAIGANEVLICSEHGNNTFSSACGEDVFINLCSIPTEGTFEWIPTSNVVNPDSSYTCIHVYENNTYYLYNSIKGLVDSVVITMQPFQVNIPQIPIVYCGWPRTLNATYHPNAIYHWTPETGLSDPNIRNPLLLLEDSLNLQYILSCEIIGCGTSYDTLNVLFNPNPWVNMYQPLQYTDTVYFFSYSTCVDEYFWDFGDGFTSTEKDPMHLYQAPGVYKVLHKGTRGILSDSVSYNFPFFWVSMEEPQSTSISVFPNPVKDILTLKWKNGETIDNVMIYNSMGKLCKRQKVAGHELFVDFSDLENGMYCIVLYLSSKRQYNTKVMVIH